MRGVLAPGYKWICHLRDHFSKYLIASAMREKSSSEVKDLLLLWIMHFGPPHILQNDNGTEFNGCLLDIARYHGIKIINSRERHPQMQELIEQANGVLISKIATWKIDNYSSSWHRALPESILAMNNQHHSSTKKTPYQIMFKQRMEYHGTLVHERSEIDIEYEVEAVVITEESEAMPTVHSSYQSPVGIEPEIVSRQNQTLSLENAKAGITSIIPPYD
jgi:transposase InsO family protein